MGRTKGAVDKVKRKKRSYPQYEKESVVGNSLSAKKANNQLLKAKGLRKCSRCNEILGLDDFEVIRYRYASPTNNSVVPVYSMTCRACAER